MEKSRTEEESGPDGAEVDAPSSSSFCVVLEAVMASRRTKGAKPCLVRSWLASKHRGMALAAMKRKEKEKQLLYGTVVLLYSKVAPQYRVQYCTVHSVLVVQYCTVYTG